MTEKQIEAWLGQQVRDLGGLYFKWVSPGNVGVPDRIIILPGGVVWFVELKQAGKRLSTRQARILLELAERGVNVRAIIGLQQAISFVAELQEAGHGL